MNPGSDTADQVVRMSMQGIEVAARVSLEAGGAVAKSLAATLYAILKDQKKVRGKTKLDNLLKSGKTLEVFAIRTEDLKTFCTEAKKYGVLYSVLKEKNSKTGVCDIMVRTEDAAKISRIVDKFELATIDTKAVRESILSGKNTPLDETPPLTDEQHRNLVEALLQRARGGKQNPEHARTGKERQFEQDSKKQKDRKKSVRERLNKINKQKNQNKTKNQTKSKNQNQSKQQSSKHRQPAKKKRSKSKAR